MLAFALQAVAAFNLVCSVTATAGTSRARSTLILRVDLERWRWCISECRTTQPLVSVTETEIWFTSSRHVSRETGRYFDYNALPSGDFRAEGTCERAPFTGFPQRRF
jgi:hypothetical protein